MTEQGPDQVRKRTRDRLQARSTGAGAALAVILLVAAVLRVLGSRWGLPMRLHPDEWAVVDGVIDMARRNSFEPSWMLRPDHVEMKIDYLAFAGYAQLFRGVSIEAAFAADPAPFFLIARLVTAAFGVGTVLLAYLIGRLSSPFVGLVAAALFALFPAFVRHAHYATPDVPLTFALMLLVYALMRYLASTSWASLLVASFAVALAIAIKYPGAVGAVMIAIVVILAAVRDRAWLRIVTHGAGSVAAVIGFLFLISPVLFTNATAVRTEIEAQSAGKWFGMHDQGISGNLSYYVSQYAHGAGVLLLVLAVVGVVVAVRSRQLEAITWLTGVVVWLSLSTLPIQWERWGLPMYVTPLLFGALGLAYVLERCWSTPWRWAGLAVATVVGVQLIAGSAAVLAALLTPDTRHAALEYSREQDLRANESAFEGYTQFRPDAPGVIFDQFHEIGGRWEPLTKGGDPAEYVVLSSGMYSRVLGKSDYDEENRIYQRIFDEYDEVHTFVPTPAAQPTWWEPLAIARNLKYARSLAKGGMSGPQIRIYAVPRSP